ncbi:MAG: hypothetical protein JO252_18180 [Planctomycetaceae bacterium]|nr:hypothetical protein [Planctomycetaceae bacterium]
MPSRLNRGVSLTIDTLATTLGHLSSVVTRTRFARLEILPLDPDYLRLNPEIAWEIQLTSGEYGTDLYGFVPSVILRE